MTLPPYRVGDRVTINGNAAGFCKAYGFEAGFVYTVIKIEEDSRYSGGFKTTVAGNGKEYGSTWFELAKNEWSNLPDEPGFYWFFGEKNRQMKVFHVLRNDEGQLWVEHSGANPENMNIGLWKRIDDVAAPELPAKLQ